MPVRNNQQPPIAAQAPLRAAEPKELSNGAAPAHSDDTLALVDKARSELDGLLANTRAVQERSSHLIQSLLEELRTKVLGAVENALGHFQTELHQRITHETSIALENLDVEESARLAARVDQALARIKENQQIVEQRLADAVAEHRETIASISARTAEEMRQRVAALRTEFVTETQAKIDEAKTAANGVAASASEAGQAFAGELGKRTDQALEALHSRIAQFESESVGRVERRINELVQFSMSRLAERVQDAADRQISKLLVQAFRNRLDQLANFIAEPDAASKSEESPADNAAAPHAPAAARMSDDAPDDPMSESDADGSDTIRKRPRTESAAQTYASRESSFRKDFESRYGSERSYDEYAPAYRFGYSLAADHRYDGKDWLSIEQDVRRLWETQSQGKWEKFKGSIQYAWLSALSD